MKNMSRWLSIASALLMLVGCSTDNAPSATVPATAVAQSTTKPTAAPTQTATAVPPTATAAPTATATAIPTPEAVVSSCLTCHSDQQLLINTAAPVVEVGESESSGVG